jgi:hypothetical protein
MSRFNPENAAEIARQSYVLRVDDTEEDRIRAMSESLLLGKEERLLEVLRDAETTFDEWLELGPARRMVQKSMGSFPRDCDRLMKHLRHITSCWSGMRQYDGQYELVCNAGNFETSDEVLIQARKIDDALQLMLAGAHRGMQQQRHSYPGAPGGSNAALAEFTKIIRLFWLAEISDSFGYNESTLDQVDGRRVPTSAAARLVFEAAQILDGRHTLGSVREAIETANEEKDPY